MPIAIFSIVIRIDMRISGCLIRTSATLNSFRWAIIIARRRRILLWRVPKQSPYYDKIHQPLLKIPFLAFADETIEDTDDVLLPIIEGIMSEQLHAMGGRV